MPRGKAEVDTVSDVWPAADWHEREAWDMIGHQVPSGTPTCAASCSRTTSIGHPLRKDYVDLVENHPHV